MMSITHPARQILTALELTAAAAAAAAGNCIIIAAVQHALQLILHSDDIILHFTFVLPFS